MNFEKILNKYAFLKTGTKTAIDLGTYVYIVGGFVRDIILERESNEIDFLVIGDGPLFASKFAGALGINNVTIFNNLSINLT